MTRSAPLIAVALALASSLVLGASCKKQPPRGDLPPATDWQSGTAVAGSNGSATPAPPNPHAGVDNPHAGMTGNPHGGPVPEQTAPKTLDKLGDGRLALGAFSVVPPSGWAARPVTSNMRVADFVLPGKAGEAELIVTYFGAAGAGSTEDNVNRWLGQFEQPDGKASRDVARIEKTRFGGQDATYVSLTGRYVNPGMPGGGGPVDKPDQALLAAIVGSPSGPYYFKLVGPRETVDAHAKAFRAMLESLKPQ